MWRARQFAFLNVREPVYVTGRRKKEKEGYTAPNLDLLLCLSLSFSTLAFYLLHFLLCLLDGSPPLQPRLNPSSFPLLFSFLSRFLSLFLRLDRPNRTISTPPLRRGSTNGIGENATPGNPLDSSFLAGLKRGKDGTR